MKTYENYYKARYQTARAKFDAAVAQAKYEYGLGTEEAKELVRRRRNGVCECCHRPGRLNIEHNHQTGAVRGVVCNKCNALIAAMEDPLRPLVEKFLE